MKPLNVRIGRGGDLSYMTSLRTAGENSRKGEIKEGKKVGLGTE